MLNELLSISDLQIEPQVRVISGVLPAYAPPGNQAIICR